MKKIGSIAINNNKPAIYFSAEETHSLAENMGHAIVGKFSQLMPSSLQIQRALEDIKFTYSYTWKYINAKHILIQFEDIMDYARMLNGPKGIPLWFVGHTPMRVFKWTWDFDLFHESPIAAIWCNLIALPLHLFDISALFAIGKLLGNPIQVDQSTADRSRLSFARLCIEIDITKTPPEEVVIEMGGNVIEVKVVWDKFPAYYSVCRHVGHKRATVMPRPGKNNNLGMIQPITSRRVKKTMRPMVRSMETNRSELKGDTNGQERINCRTSQREH